MIEIKNREKCCGCHACYNACPQNAITMIEDEYGFKYPKIDKTKCIDCKICEKVCPMLNTSENGKCLSAWCVINNNIKDRMNSSSGGVFSLLAKEIISNNGVVFGATFNDEYNVVHSYIDCVNDLYKMQGSKYVQSSINKTFQLAKKFLDEGKTVLFTGTSCQIEGLKLYLKKEYNNLYTQDIICHGVPAPNVWREYLKYQTKKNGKIKDIQFRNKDYGWTLYQMKILFDTNTYRKCYKDDFYMNAFLYDLCLRDSCYECPFKKNYRISDITLADFWGIDKVKKDYNDDKGVSAVIINTKKGEILFEKIKEHCKFDSVELNQIIEYNSAYIKSPSKNNNRVSFLKNINNMEFDKLIKKYIKKPTILNKIIKRAKKIIFNNK